MRFGQLSVTEFVKKLLDRNTDIYEKTRELFTSEFVLKKNTKPFYAWMTFLVSYAVQKGSIIIPSSYFKKITCLKNKTKNKLTPKNSTPIIETCRDKHYKIAKKQINNKKTIAPIIGTYHDEYYNINYICNYKMLFKLSAANKDYEFNMFFKVFYDESTFKKEWQELQNKKKTNKTIRWCSAHFIACVIHVLKKNNVNDLREFNECLFKTLDNLALQDKDQDTILYKFPPSLNLNSDEKEKLKKVRLKKMADNLKAKISTFLDTEFFENPTPDEIYEILLQSHQIILEGPPGTGKTWMAEHDLKEKLFKGKLLDNESKDDHFLRVQLHPGYEYSLFIGGLRPETGKNEKMTYEYKSGVFKEFCEKAFKDKAHPYLLLLDEINRAPINSIFGELLYALDKRGEDIVTVSSEILNVPDNLYIIGTMNTADKSLNTLDYALHRRFAFITINSCIPDLDSENKLINLSQSKEKKEEKKFDIKAYNKTKELFSPQYLSYGTCGDQIMLGPAYFYYRKDCWKKFNIRYKVIPTLLEYYKDGYFNPKAKIKKGQNSKTVKELFSLNGLINYYDPPTEAGDSN